MNASTGLSPYRAAVAALAAFLALGAAACGSSASSGTAASSASASPSGAQGSPDSGDGGLVLRVRDGGGFAPRPASGLPLYSLYGDGTLVSVRSSEASSRQAPLPAPRVARLSSGQLGAVEDAARDAGLGRAGTLGPTPPPDAFTRSYRFGGALTTTVAPEMRDCAAQHALCALDERLASLAEPSEPYRYTTLAAVFHETGKGTSSGAATWPLGDLAGAGERTGQGRCLLIRGADRERVERAARTAGSQSWTDGTATYRVVLRPLLPGEKTCADVAGDA
ncbi:hypothetical protein ACFY93_29885 [Streptomyces sp. NPDC008313]|uniref:hypothetical protein n=1 Tax=Streptomyces sp. NPDC008313 TaxID=3364826 RepID=UPI0036EF68FE